MRSFAADHAFSAAYLLGSSPGEIVVTRSGGVGSIGVVTAHVEYSKMLEDMGVKVTFIFAGEHKVDGNAYEKLPDDVKSRIQAQINRLYGEFTSTVARNREMDEKAVRDTKALTYDANEAIVVGLADRIGALEDEMTIFSEEATVTENEQMANDKQAPEVKGIDQATHDAAVATARTEGASAEKGRIKAILACDEGKNRPKAAFSCAMNTEMSLEEAKAFLADLPEEKALAEQPAKAEQPAATAPGKTPFETAMDSSGNPDVGVELRAAEDEDLGDDAKAAESILAAYASATGKKRKVA